MQEWVCKFFGNFVQEIEVEVFFIFKILIKTAFRYICMLDNPVNGCLIKTVGCELLKSSVDYTASFLIALVKKRFIRHNERNSPPLIVTRWSHKRLYDHLVTMSRGLLPRFGLLQSELLHSNRQAEMPIFVRIVMLQRSTSIDENVQAAANT
jgi:hypothetical protein